MRGGGTWPLVHVVVDLAVPVLAAGGIANGRGLAAAMALSAAGALIGTRFQATTEAPVAPATTKAIIEGRGQDTERSSVLDIAPGSQWPSNYPARTLGHPYVDRWRGREAEFVGDSQAKQDYQNEMARGAIPPLPVWAGGAIDLITDLPSAGSHPHEPAGEAAELRIGTHGHTSNWPSLGNFGVLAQIFVKRSQRVLAS